MFYGIQHSNMFVYRQVPKFFKIEDRITKSNFNDPGGVVFVGADANRLWSITGAIVKSQNRMESVAASSSQQANARGKSPDQLTGLCAYARPLLLKSLQFGMPSLKIGTVKWRGESFWGESVHNTSAEGMTITQTIEGKRVTHKGVREFWAGTVLSRNPEVRSITLRNVLQGPDGFSITNPPTVLNFNYDPAISEIFPCSYEWKTTNGEPIESVTFDYIRRNTTDKSLFKPEYYCSTNGITQLIYTNQSWFYEAGGKLRPFNSPKHSKDKPGLHTATAKRAMLVAFGLISLVFITFLWIAYRKSVTNRIQKTQNK